MDHHRPPLAREVAVVGLPPRVVAQDLTCLPHIQAGENKLLHKEGGNLDSLYNRVWKQKEMGVSTIRASASDNCARVHHGSVDYDP